ncbi:MAG TPA: hypothetical protein ENK66_07105 [Arcobacter sp.]|jgi:dolichyl-phosphate-mannose--protein O-mannosyl transferase|nr:hypothetical protein [Arcobacter sp.]
MHTIKLDIQDNIYEHVIFLLKSLDSKGLNITEYRTENKNNKYDILEKSAGLLASQNIDPLKWQEEIRSEWDEREELLARLQHNHISS